MANSVPAGGSGSVSKSGTTVPTTPGAGWEIVDPDGTVLATNASPGGWAVNGSDFPVTVQAPAGATIAIGYKVRVSAAAGAAP